MVLFGRSGDLKPNGLSSAFNNNSKREKRAALPFEVYKTAELSYDFGADLETVRIAVRQGGDADGRASDRFEDRLPSFAQLIFGQCADYG